MKKRFFTNHPACLRAAFSVLSLTAKARVHRTGPQVSGPVSAAAALLTLLCFLCAMPAAHAQPFVTTWKTDNPGQTGNNQILIPGTGTNYAIAWEQVGNPAVNGTATGNGPTTLTLPTPGSYRVSISPGSGTFTRIEFNFGGDRQKLTGIAQWGSIAWSNMENAFDGCSNLASYTATDAPNLSAVASTARMFASCTQFNGAIGNWNVGSVANMSFMFAGASAFNQPIGNWDVGSVTNMSFMFQQASAFNQPIGNWDVGSVTNMYAMFNVASAFNQPIGNWNVGSVSNMSSMFAGASDFNQPIGNWDVGSVNNMSYMFANASAFNQPIGNWDVGSVTNIIYIFYGASTFNQPLGYWALNANVDMGFMLNFLAMDCGNYSATLIGWAANPSTPSGRSLGAFGRQYGTNASAARNTLTATKGWTISGDTQSNTVCAPSCTAQGSPAVFGDNTWNVYAWNVGGASYNNNNNAWNSSYSGFYTSGTLSFSSENDWNINAAPSAANNYQGCPVQNDNHSWSAKRKGFPAGYYRLDVAGHDDAAQLFINENPVWQHNGCCDSHTGVWTGALDANSKVEFRATEGSGGSFGTLDFVNLCPSGNILYVKANATGANNGSSWADAFTDLQSALALNCPNVTQIWRQQLPRRFQQQRFEQQRRARRVYHLRGECG